jgi:hypothetical protein
MQGPLGGGVLLLAVVGVDVPIPPPELLKTPKEKIANTNTPTMKALTIIIKSQSQVLGPG